MNLADLREGMRVKGTVVTTVPTTVVSRARNVTGQAPTPPKPVATPTLIGVLLIEQADYLRSNRLKGVSRMRWTPFVGPFLAVLIWGT